MRWDDQVQTRFSSRGDASKWTRMYSEATPRVDEHFFRLRRDFTVDYMTRELSGARRILDLGCGSGPVITELRARGRDCVGLDYSAEMLGHASARLASSDVPPTSLIRGDSRTLPFADASFDAVVCLGVISYVKDYRPVLAELFRVLRPGGTVILTFRNRFNPILSDPVGIAKALVKRLIRWKGEDEPWVGRFLDHRIVQRDMAEAGLVRLGFEGIGYGPFRIAARRVFGEGRVSIAVSDALTRLLSLPILSWLSPWLCDVSVWLYQRPHIDGTRSLSAAGGPDARAVARG